MAKSKRSRIQSQSDVLEELFRSAANEEIRKVRDAFSRILEVKEKLLEEKIKLSAQLKVMIHKTIYYKFYFFNNSGSTRRKRKLSSS